MIQSDIQRSHDIYNWLKIIYRKPLSFSFRWNQEDCRRHVQNTACHSSPILFTHTPYSPILTVVRMDLTELRWRDWLFLCSAQKQSVYVVTCTSCWANFKQETENSLQRSPTQHHHGDGRRKTPVHHKHQQWRQRGRYEAGRRSKCELKQVYHVAAQNNHQVKNPVKPKEGRASMISSSLKCHTQTNDTPLKWTRRDSPQGLRGGGAAREPARLALVVWASDLGGWHGGPWRKLEEEEEVDGHRGQGVREGAPRGGRGTAG